MVANTDFGALPANAKGNFEPFAVNIAQEILDQLQTLLKVSPIGGKTYENTRPNGRLGIRHECLTNAVESWKSEFDWCAP